MFRAKLVRTENIAGQIKAFWFDPQRRVRYAAGQYLDMHVPHSAPDNRGTVRTMSLNSSPTEPLLGMTTTFERADGSTYKRALLTLEPGDYVDMTDPMGDFVLPKNPSIPLVFVAGGIGITPVRGMIKWLLDMGEQRRVQLVYIARSPESMLYVPLLESYPHIQLIRLYTKAAPAGEQIQKRPTTAELLKLIGRDSGKLIYLSGPESMMEAYWEELQQHGVPREQLVLDYFTGYVTL